MADQSQATEDDNNNQLVAAEPYDPFNDPSRKAKSKDPGWKYGFWPEKDKKDFVQCVLCGKRVHAGIGRLKRHLAGGYEDVEKCANTTTSIMREMRAFLTKNSRSKVVVVDSNDEAEGGGGEDDEETIHPSSGTTTKRKHATARHGIVGTSMVKVDGPPTKVQKSVASMLQKTLEEVVVDRHSKGASQITFENCFKKNQEDKQKVDLYVADFWYECGLPFNAINSRSWEIVCESIGQYGLGHISPRLVAVTT